ncbi:DsbA family oxidoreductase [Paenilisteria rocourtiae]|uniref:Putative DsbA family dithiol-disulfide isomerase n=1 Tax=Listeria rocourtiae TaxID=647910 RepID=A0A4R6ZS27_9LIST|nr:DsbA family oxidoreductase [Listeria rocourtiae]EUJ48117.1 protein disulfide isomerase [Listeria rocourtiae FSL F6-920]MBC1603185.1 DsbA family oxidoreductase [Listeria rocourtiae]TDR55533.1 putative DsbA family dithiol-disulfide isomerase [Listeria rocourtiae]
MKVEIWSDFACPFCYIGKRNFEKGLKEFGKEVEIEYRSFELDPSAPTQYDQTMDEILAEKYGMTVEKAKSMNDQVSAQAKTVGLDYHFDTMVPTNTFDAHRLLQFAKTKGTSESVKEALLYSYFTESKNLSDHETLATIAEANGLDKTETLEMLASDAFATNVRDDEQTGASLGIQGVPFFVINEKYGVSGAQPATSFTEVLNKVWKEENPLTMLNKEDSEDQCCSGGSCNC